MTAHPELDFTRPIRQVAGNAEAHRPGFAEEAKAMVLELLRQLGPTSGEALTEGCKAAGISPHDDRAFGSIYQQLSRQGKIARHGYCARVRGHGTCGGIVWKLAEVKL